VKLNTKTRYGVRAMYEIAKADQEEGIFQKDISLHQKISLKYLDHIIDSLKTARLITTVRGHKSGYKLARPATDITMLDIHYAFGPDICIVDCLIRTSVCEMVTTCPSREFWGGLNNLIYDYLKSVSLDDLVKKHIPFE
jgi:Rrf2 family protein